MPRLGVRSGISPGPIRAHSLDVPTPRRGCDGDSREADTSPNSSFLLPEQHGPAMERSLAQSLSSPRSGHLGLTWAQEAFASGLLSEVSPEKKLCWACRFLLGCLSQETEWKPTEPAFLSVAGKLRGRMEKRGRKRPRRRPVLAGSGHNEGTGLWKVSPRQGRRQMPGQSQAMLQAPPTAIWSTFPLPLNLGGPCHLDCLWPIKSNRSDSVAPGSRPPGTLHPTVM